MNDCEEVKEISKYIRKWISEQPSVKEESLTDYMLYELSSKIPQIKYRAFSRHEEAKKTGADWEWWFVFSDSCAYKFRIQAKKTYLDNYPNIVYTNKHGLQIEKLLEDAIETNSIPLYAFYTNENGKVMCARAISDEGVYMAGAAEVYSSFITAKSRKVLAQDILNITNPLSCFFCCDLLVDKKIYLLRFFNEYYKKENVKYIQEILNKEGKNDNSQLGLHKDIPDYISVLMKQENNIDNRYENEFRNKIKDIDAIMVYDVRNKEMKR